ncbi:hypothetical protein CCACVL1_21745 [Corchorus capsularis]|uniref:Uncharacterized protein n=1 Tax=Corchorus capsularis TaxID=210143 RepID=A0A1R3H271_COCAP|nr:hypothetical protein CCACVL1_21745 [Corchorus capsularis]
MEKRMKKKKGILISKRHMSS